MYMLNNVYIPDKSSKCVSVLYYLLNDIIKHEFQCKSTEKFDIIVSKMCDTPLRPSADTEGRSSAILFQQKRRKNSARDVKIVTGYKSQVPPLRPHSWICSEVSAVRKSARLIVTFCPSKLRNSIWMFSKNQQKDFNIEEGGRSCSRVDIKCVFSVCFAGLLCRRLNRRGLWTTLLKFIFFSSSNGHSILFLPPVCSWRKG